MKLSLKLIAVACIVCGLALTSCSGEDGTDGVDGIDGVDGKDGKDGVDGANGVDGNANVQAYIYDASTFSGNIFVIDNEELTDEVIANNAVLFYIKKNQYYYSVPGVGPGALFTTRSYFTTGTANLNFRTLDGTDHYYLAAGDIDEVRMIIASPTATTTGKSSNASIQDVLKAAGVDINDYEAVMAYLMK